MLSLLKLAGECSEVRVVYWVQPFAHERVGGVVTEGSVNTTTIQQFKWRQKEKECHNGVLPVLHVPLYP